MLVGIVEFLGWFGAVAVLGGYILFSLGKIPNGPLYQVINLVGGLAVAVNVAAHHAVPSTIVNGIWAVVAAVVLVRMVLRRRRAPASEQAPVLLVEPPTTTAVLPVVGPALRDHEADATAAPEPSPGLPAVPASPAVPAGVADAPAPMTESVPVITAAIALALVQAARQQHAAQQQAADPTPVQPERADAP
ncbi:CBU_0592 family membrane protein [Curtobacterium aetherium]|uniref:Uncharacterized protein n=1 Tax=Curtobacterium aetherium TaxID=2841594 RepID=A0ACD1E339_9MICO|nr:hypothetical protein [Curtobacterium sp. L6-1]QWS33408.1 hypothetical protein KM842_14410 [Curtobacterium sp. L6-1]